MAHTQKSQIKRKELVHKIMNSVTDQQDLDMTVKNICSLADISIGNFYHYFKDRDDLINEISCVIDDYILSDIVPKFTENQLQNLHLLIVGYGEYISFTQSHLAHTLNTLAATLPDSSEAIEAERKRPLYQVPLSIFEKGIETNQFHTAYSAEELTDYLVVSLRGISNDWSRRQCITNVQKNYEIFSSIFVSALEHE